MSRCSSNRLRSLFGLLVLWPTLVLAQITGGGGTTSGGGGGAPVGATYITQTPNGTLTSEQALSALTTGLLKVTTSTGVLSTAVAADVPDLSATYSPIAGNASLVTVGTIGTGTWNATAIADGKIAAALTGKTINGNTFTSGTYTLTGAAGKTLTFSNSLTLAGTDSTTMTFPATSATMARIDAGQTFTGVQAFTAPTIATGLVITEAVGTSALVLTGATQTSSFPALSLTQTWNNAGVAFTGASFTITNTASASSSRILKILAGASTVADFKIDGSLTIANAGTVTTGYFVTNNVSNAGLQARSDTAQLTFGVSDDTIIRRGGSAAVFQLGNDVNGAAIAQTLTCANGITGTDNTGCTFAFKSGKGTGAGAASTITLGTPTVLTTGTTAQTITTRLTVSSASLLGTVPVIAPYLQSNTIYSAAGTPLPTCNGGLEGSRAAVSDATLPTFLTAYTSGGAVHASVYCDGTSWKTE